MSRNMGLPESFVATVTPSQCMSRAQSWGQGCEKTEGTIPHFLIYNLPLLILLFRIIICCLETLGS